MRSILLFAAAPILLASQVRAAPLQTGQQAFERHCAECHAPGVGHPGTQQLGWVRGPAKAELERRTDLTPAYVVFVARHGLAEMPPFRPTELGDADLQSIARYLAPARHPESH